MAKTIGEKILSEMESYERSNGRKPDCVLVDKYDEKRIPPHLFSSQNLTIFGMHLIVVDGMPHNVIRCGMMR